MADGRCERHVPPTEIRNPSFVVLLLHSVSGGDMKLTKTEKDFIQPMRVVRLATVDADGSAHNVPVCPLVDTDSIYFGTERNARKILNIKANPRVTVVFDEYTEAWDYLRGAMIQGTARIGNASEFRRLRK